MSVELVVVANAGESTLSVFELTSSGLNRLTVTSLPGRCTCLAVDPARSLVFAGAGSDILTLALASDGTLTPRSTQPTEGSLNYLVLTADGSRLLGISYSGGWGHVWSVGADGTLAEPSATVHYPNLHSVAASSDGRFAYFVSLHDDLIACYSMDATGALAPLQTAAAPAGSGPRHIVLDAREQNVYVLTEFSADVLHYRRASDGTLAFAGKTAAYVPDRGLSLSRFGADPRAEHLIWGADVHLAPDGHHLWATERSESTIATLPVDADGSVGQPTAYEQTEPQPRGLCVTGDGRVLVTGELSTTVSLYTADLEGILTLQDQAETGKGANWARAIRVG